MNRQRGARKEKVSRRQKNESKNMMNTYRTPPSLLYLLIFNLLPFSSLTLSITFTFNKSHSKLLLLCTKCSVQDSSEKKRVCVCVCILFSEDVGEVRLKG